MHHRCIERRHLLDGVGQRLRLLLQVHIQPPMPLTPSLYMVSFELLAEVLAHQRVGIEPFVLLHRQQPRSLQLRHRLVPCGLADEGQGVRQPGDHRFRTQGRDFAVICRPVEEPDPP